MKRSLLVFVVLALAAGVWAQAAFKAFEGKPAPGFKMIDVKGKTYTSATLKGKVVLLDFWATWCGPCKAASPTMQALHQKYARRGLVVIGANTFEEGDGKVAAATYAREHKYTFPFTYGNDHFAQSLGIRGIPAFVFIDKTGRIAKIAMGFDTKKSPPEFESVVKRLLG